ncbi:DUF111 family protein [Candidatus Micrarchaeota archaeon]|nr:DUF111 family protein [Candidatus Micrarchaeota archaeon]
MTKLVFVPEMGCSGDMVLGALADLGAGDEIKEGIRTALGYKISFKDALKHGVHAKILETDLNEKCPPTRIMELIRSSADILEFDDYQMKFAWDTFETILEAEKSIHRIDEAYMSDIANIDTVVDIVGATIGLGVLDAFSSDVISGPVAVGTRPAAAAIYILKKKKFNFYSRDIKHELCTPTGASIIANIAQGVGKMPEMKKYKEGCGGGSRNFHLPNVLRLRIL